LGNSTRIITFLAIILAIYSCENDVKEIAKYDLEDFPDQTARDIEVLYSTKGEVAFQLNAPLFLQYTGEEPYNEMPEGVHVLFFDSLLNVTTELTSNYAIHIENENRMEAKEDVVVINEKGEKLNTEHLVWDQNTQLITSDVFVKITTEDQVLMGEGLEANQDFTKYKILKPRGVINIKDE